METYGDRHVNYPKVGERFGSWTFVAPGDGYNWVMQCVCGTTKSVRSQDVRMHRSSSCGCLKNNTKSLGGLKNKTHGMDYGSKLYRTWRNAKNRCFNPNALKYQTYGAKGLTMDDTWANDFLAFAAALGEPPSPLHTIDRKDNTKGYIPGNVRWATASEQVNNRQMTINATLNGVTRPLAEWVEVTGIAYNTLQYRRKVGWTDEEALTIPTGIRRKTNG